MRNFKPSKFTNHTVSGVYTPDGIYSLSCYLMHFGTLKCHIFFIDEPGGHRLECKSVDHRLLANSVYHCSLSGACSSSESV